MEPRAASGARLSASTPDRRAILLTLRRDNEELFELAQSAGLKLVDTAFQSRAEPDPRTFLGSGTIEALAARLAGRPVEMEGPPGAPLAGIDLALLAADLKASTILRLQKELGVEVWDRTRLILEIFTDRANSQEARLQVELARLRYEQPLVREAIHLEKSGERPGYLGSGEMAFVEYQTHLRSRMARIRDELAHVEGERSVRRQHRRRGGFWVVALAGYTNAGKSTLLNALTEGGAESEDRLFSTLATRTRRVTRGGGSRLLLTDTVGFIEDLPPWLIDAFHATLEEVTLADVILLVVDASDEPHEIGRKLHTSLETLRHLRRLEARPFDLEDATRGRRDPKEHAGQRRKVVLVLNKMDRAKTDPEALEALSARFGLEEDRVLVSAVTGEGLEALLEAARGRIADRDELRLRVPADGAGQAFVAWVADEAETRIERSDGAFDLTVGIRHACRDELDKRLRRAGGRVVSGGR